MTKLISFLPLLPGCDPDYTNTIISTIPSPNAQWKATLFTRDCGATTLENTQIIITPASQPFDPKHQLSIFIIEPEGPVTAQWTSPTNLQVTYAKTSRLFTQKTNHQCITIEYIAK